MKLTNYKTYFGANKMSHIQAKYMDNKLKSAKNVDIICHDMTDRDCANSALAMWKYLEANAINSRVIISQSTPLALGLQTYDFNMVQATDNEEVSKITPDIAFCVDFGSEERILPNVREHIKKADDVMGFDHHIETDIARGNFVQIRKPLEENTFSSCADFYSDTSAKSATSIIYRFFEALGEDIDNNTAYDLFSGFVDDASKRGLLECDGILGRIMPKKALMEDKNAYEVFKSLYSKLTKEQIKQISSKIDIMANLSKEESDFYNSLYKRAKFAKNGKIAYVEIPPDDKYWEKLGRDNSRTSRILNRFRQNILKDKGIEVAIVFYSTDSTYRLSVHSNKIYLSEFYNRALNNLKNYDGFSLGGHGDRGGGKIESLDNKVCHQFVKDIIKCLNQEM